MKDELIKQLIDAKNRIRKCLNLLPDNRKFLGEWSKKEILSHIVGWYEEGVLATPKILKGEKPDSFTMSIDEYNKRSVEKRKNKTIQQIQEEEDNLHTEWVKQLKNLDEKQITGFYGTKLGKKEINLVWIINEAISHDNSHAEDIEKRFRDLA